jgi:integrase
MALIAKGIYRDKSGIRIRVSVRGKPREFRKDEHKRPYKTWTKAQLIVERKRIDAREHLKQSRQSTVNTMREDVQRYLSTLTGRTRDDAENLLRHWLIFGDRHRDELTAVDLRQHAATWTTPEHTEIAASTYNHRRQALISLYTALNGRSGYNPAREMPKRKELQGAPKALSYTVIRKALKAMPETQSRARLKLMAYTGLPQMQIQKLTPEDWQGSKLRVTPRRKGSGAAGRWIPLSRDAVAAMKEFARLECWGNFSRSSLWKAWKAFGPPGSNPYSLRHSWITELYRRSNGDVLAVKQLALHSMLQQTERYAAAALEDRMSLLVLPRSLATTTPGNRSNPAQSGPVRQKARRGNRRGRTAPKREKSAAK